MRAWSIPTTAIMTLALVSFMDVVCAAGQFIARASSTALASTASERRLPLVARPWLAIAVRKWSAVMARLAGCPGAALASFTQRSAARWQV